MSCARTLQLLVAGIAITLPTYAQAAPLPVPARVTVSNVERESSDTLAWPSGRPYRHKRTIETVHDSLAHSATTSIVIDKGRYLLWMQRPRVTLAVERPDTLSAGQWPTHVLIEFETKSPQYTATNILTVTAAELEPLSAPATASRIRQRTFVTEHALTFALPLSAFLSVLHGDAVTLEVGGVIVRLRREQLEALRDFALRVHDAAR